MRTRLLLLGIGALTVGALATVYFYQERQPEFSAEIGKSCQTTISLAWDPLPPAQLTTQDQMAGAQHDIGVRFTNIGSKPVVNFPTSDPFGVKFNINIAYLSMWSFILPENCVYPGGDDITCTLPLLQPGESVRVAFIRKSIWTPTAHSSNACGHKDTIRVKRLGGGCAIWQPSSLAADILQPSCSNPQGGEERKKKQ